MVELIAYRKAPVASKAAAMLYVVTGTILLMVGLWQWFNGNIKGTALLILVGIFLYSCAALALYPNQRIKALLYALTGTCSIILGLWYYSGGFDYIIPTAILIVYGIGLYIGAGLSLYNMSIMFKATN